MASERAELALKAWDYICSMDIVEPGIELNTAIRRVYASVPGFQHREPRRPVAWWRPGPDGGPPLMAMGDWPPPEPDDTAWYPLYSSDSASAGANENATHYGGASKVER